MRIIDFYNVLAAAVLILLVLITAIRSHLTALRSSAYRCSNAAASHAADAADLKSVAVSGNISMSAGCTKEKISRREILLFVLFLSIGCCLRLLMLTKIPAGLNQDEASIGYEAYSLAEYGIDRNGYPYPVYPITFGSGGGSVLMIYLNMIIVRLFGSSVLTLRLTTAVLGCATLAVFYCLVREMSNVRTALTALLCLSLTPWHIMLSRWSLDSNTVPFFLALAAYCFVKGQKSGRTQFYAVSAGIYSLCLYCYGSATLIVPLHLILICIYCMRRHVLRVRQLLISLLVFLVIFLPIGVFYAVNFLNLPEVVTPYFSVEKFTSSRASTFLIPGSAGFVHTFLEYFRRLCMYLTVGYEDTLITNCFPGYAELLRFTFPLSLAGLVLCVIRMIQKSGKGEAVPDASMIFLMLSAGLMSLFMDANVNRMVLFFLPQVYFLAAGIDWILQKGPKRGALAVCVCLIGCCSFIKDYFTQYNELSQTAFMPGYGEAVECAQKVLDADENAKVISTYDGLSSPFLIALFYSKESPAEFCTTVHYKDPDSVYRVADSFGRYTFGLPETVTDSQSIDAADYPETVFLLSGDDISRMDLSGYEVTRFGNYAAAVPSDMISSAR